MFARWAILIFQIFLFTAVPVLSFSQADPLVGTWFCQSSFRMTWGEVSGSSYDTFTLNPDGTYNLAFSSNSEWVPNDEEFFTSRDSGTINNLILKDSRVIISYGNDDGDVQYFLESLVKMKGFQGRAFYLISGNTMWLIEQSNNAPEYISGEETCQKQ